MRQRKMEIANWKICSKTSNKSCNVINICNKQNWNSCRYFQAKKINKIVCVAVLLRTLYGERKRTRDNERVRPNKRSKRTGYKRLEKKRESNTIKRSQKTWSAQFYQEYTYKWKNVKAQIATERKNDEHIVRVLVCMFAKDAQSKREIVTLWCQWTRWTYREHAYVDNQREWVLTKFTITQSVNLLRFTPNLHCIVIQWILLRTTHDDNFFSCACFICNEHEKKRLYE